MQQCRPYCILYSKNQNGTDTVIINYGVQHNMCIYNFKYRQTELEGNVSQLIKGVQIERYNSSNNIGR